MPHGFNDNKTKADIGTIAANAVINKVDKVAGMGLSENNYTDAEKAIVDAFPTNLGKKVDKEAGKGLSANDFTNAYKTKVDESSYNTSDGTSVVLARNGTTYYSAYTCPHNGYIQMSCSGSTAPYFKIRYDATYGYSIREDGGTSSDNPYTLTFVKKGSVIYQPSAGSNASVIYYPLTSYT